MTHRFLALAALALTAGCSASSNNTPAPEPVALVTLATAQSGNVTSSLKVYGAIEQNADTQFALSAPAEAIVSRIAAPAGTPVRRGQLVVALSPSPSTRADIARLSAEAQSAKQAYERAQRLRSDGLVSDAEVEGARTAAAAANASQSAISVQAEQLALTAPGSGFVQSIASNIGDLVPAGTTIATISRNGDLRARFGVDPAIIDRLSRAAGIRIAAVDGEAGVLAPIVAVDPSADPQTRLASIYAVVPASLGAGAGQPLSGEIALEQVGGGIVVPYAALLDDGGQPYVFVVTDSTAQRKDVTIGAANADSVAITSGIAAGDQVVTQGGTALEDGMKVRTK